MTALLALVGFALDNVNQPLAAIATLAVALGREISRRH